MTPQEKLFYLEKYQAKGDDLNKMELIRVRCILEKLYRQTSGPSAGVLQKALIDAREKEATLCKNTSSFDDRSVVAFIYGITTNREEN